MTIEKDGRAAHQARAEDALSRHTQFNFIFVASVAINMVSRHFTESQSLTPPQQSPRHDALIQSEDSCVLLSSAASYLSLYFWVHKNLGAFPRGLKQKVTCAACTQQNVVMVSGQ